MQEAQFSLIVGDATQERGRISSSDVQLLRDFGMQFACHGDPENDLLLLGPCGSAVERFDVWTREWRSES